MIRRTMKSTRVLESKFDEIFDINSSDGFSKDALIKLVSVIGFLSKHYREIPEEMFKNYLKASSEILSWKDAKYPGEKNSVIPAGLWNDLADFATS